MAHYKIKARHTGGKSIAHECTTGIFVDPVDIVNGMIVEASGEGAALNAAWRELRFIKAQIEPCPCGQVKSKLGDDWVSSITVAVERI